MNALAAAGWGALGAASLLLGAWLAMTLRPSTRTVGLIMGFGAGALLGAVAYELIPRGSIHSAWSFAALGAGALVFYAADLAITGRHRRDAGTVSESIALGALLDGVPESIVLGMGLAAGGSVSIAFLAAVFLSNLPEALGATAGMRAAGEAPARIYRVWTSIIVVSAVCAALGYTVLRLVPRADGGYVEAFAAGAVVTMLANSMMPEALREGGRLTGPITVLGLAVTGALSVLE